MNQLVDDYLKGSKAIIEINEDTAHKIVDLNKERREMLDDIDKRMRALQEEEAVIKKLYADAEAKLHEKEKEAMAPYHLQKAAVQRIIHFLEVAEWYRPVDEIGTEMMQSERDKGKFYEWQEYLYADDYLKIRLLMAENQKPVNKFSVLAYGRCVFGEPLIKLPYFYGTHLNDSYAGFSIRAEIKDFKTVEDAKAYIEKYKAKMLKDIIELVKALEAEYADVVKTWKLSDFDALCEYRCYDCRRTFKQNTNSHTAKNYRDGREVEEPCTGTLYRQVIS